MKSNRRSTLLAAALLFFEIVNAIAGTANETKLIQLAKARFTNKLSIAEERLFRAAANGELAYCIAVSNNDPDPSRANTLFTNLVMRSDCLAWLCTDPMASKLVTH